MSLTISCNGYLIWINKNGCWHREEGPALITTFGSMQYRLNHQHHNLNGPAEICRDGTKYYYLNGKRYSKAEYYSKVKEL